MDRNARHHRIMPAPSDCDFIFVYGTLRQGGGSDLHRLLAEFARCLGAGTVQGELYLVSTYPGWVPSSDSSARVRGDLYELVAAPEPRNELLERLDSYEGYESGSPETSLYVRELRNVELNRQGDGVEVVEAWTYRFNRPTTALKRIPSGDFFDR